MDPIDPERSKVAREKFADYEQECRQQASQAVIDFGSGTIRMAFLLNGGAIIALLTLVGSMFGGDDVTKAIAAVSFARALEIPFILYGAGVVAAALASGIAYLNYSAVDATHLDSAGLYFFLNGRMEPPPTWLDHFTKWSARANTVIVLGSIGSFAYASWLVIAAIGTIRL